MKKYYQILGLEEGASKQEIQVAYDKLSVELDPKNNDDLDFFKEEFALLQEAYEKLMGHVPESIDNGSKEIVEPQKPDPNSSKMALGDDKKLISRKNKEAFAKTKEEEDSKPSEVKPPTNKKSLDSGKILVPILVVVAIVFGLFYFFQSDNENNYLDHFWGVNFMI